MNSLTPKHSGASAAATPSNNALLSAVASSTHIASTAASPGETPHHGDLRRQTGGGLGSFLSFAPHGSFHRPTPRPTGFDASADDRFVASQRTDGDGEDDDLAAACAGLTITVGCDDDDDDDDDDDATAIHAHALVGPQSVDDDELHRGLVVSHGINAPWSPSGAPPVLTLDVDVGNDDDEPTPSLPAPAAAGFTLGSSMVPRSARRGRGLVEIVDGVLLLGSYRDTVDAAECARLGVGAFLCVAAGCAPPPHALESGAPTLSLALADDATERLADHIPAACAFIEAQAAAGRRTAIFCRKGRSRSVSLAIAFVMRRTGMSAQEALDHVAARYDRAEPNFAFLRQLGIVGSSNSGGP